MPAARTPRTERTRAKILAAAKRVLANGDGKLEMSVMAKAAGVSHGAAYHHFGSKEGLLCAVVEDFYDRLESDVLLAKLETHEDWETRERERVRRYIVFLLSDPVGRIVQSLAHSPSVAAVESKRWSRLISVGAKNVAQGKRNGSVTARQRSELLAAMLLGAARSAVAVAMESSKDPVPDRLTDQIWVFLRRGLALRSSNEPAP